MDQTVFPSALKYVLLSGVETVAFVAVLIVACRRVSESAARWLGVLGGLLGALASGAFTVAWAQVQWADSFEVLDYMTENTVMQHADWGQAIAVAFLAAAYIVALPRRA
jgi:hypothetical protein